MSDTDEDFTFHRLPNEMESGTMFTIRGMSPMSVQSFPHCSRMQYPPSYSQNTSKLMYNKRCRSPMSVRSYGQWGYNDNRCLSTMSVRSTDSNVSALDIQLALKDINKYNKHDFKIIKNSILNAYKQVKNYDRRRIAKRKNLKSFLTQCRRTSDSADDDDDDRAGESGADGSDSSISDDCRSTRSALYTRHIPRGRPRRYNAGRTLKMDFNMITEQVRDSENYKDCTANIKQNTLRNSLGSNRTLDHGLAPCHNQQNITHDSRNVQLSKNDPISIKDCFVKDTSMHLPYQSFNKNGTYQHNITHEKRNAQLSETQKDQFREPQNGSISLKDRFAKDTSMLLPCQRFNKNVSYKVSYTQKSTTVHQEQSKIVNRYDEDIFPQTSGTVNSTKSDTNTLQQKRIPAKNKHTDNEEFFSHRSPTQFNTNTLKQKRILDNVASSQTKRTKLLTNKKIEASPKRSVMQKLIANNNEKTSALNKKIALSGLEQYWNTDFDTEEEHPMTSSSMKTLQKNQQNNKDEFNFKKPQMPIRKLGTVMRNNQSDVLIAKSSQALVHNGEPMFKEVKEIPHTVTNHEEKETTSEQNHKQPTQNHCDTVNDNSMADSTHNTTDLSMRPSFIKRKLFTQTLDMAQDTNISSDNVNSPQTKVLRACREKNRVRKLTSQSCLSRDVTNDSNYLDLIHKIVPPEQIKNQNINNTYVNKKQTRKSNQEKQDNWDVSLALSICNDDPKSDTYTDEEIFYMPQKNKKVTQIKKVTDKAPKEDASKSNQNGTNCKVVIQKLTSLEDKNKDTSPKRGVRKKKITNNNDFNFKKPSGLTKKTALSALEKFWDTDFTDEEESMTSCSARTLQKNQQENKENDNKSLNRSKGSAHNRNPNKVLKNNNIDPNGITNNHILKKAIQKNSKQETSTTVNAKSTKNIIQSQTKFNTSRESLRLKEKKQSSESCLADKNHSIDSPSNECNTSRQSLRIKQKALANSYTKKETNNQTDNKSTKKNKQEKPKTKTQSQSTFNISKESLRKSCDFCLTDKNHNIRPLTNECDTLSKKPIRVAKLNCKGKICTNRRK